MAGLYVTLIKLDPGAQTRVSHGPFQRVELDEDDVVGIGPSQDDETPLAYRVGMQWHEYDGKAYYDRVEITEGEPE